MYVQRMRDISCIPMLLCCSCTTISSSASSTVVSTASVSSSSLMASISNLAILEISFRFSPWRRGSFEAGGLLAESSERFPTDLPATLVVAGPACSLEVALVTVLVRRDLRVQVELLDALVNAFLLL